MPPPDDTHLELLRDAVATEAAGQRALLEGVATPEALREAAARYRASWEAAPPRSYGRLVGMLKAAVLAGDARADAAYARAQLGAPGDPPPASPGDSPTASYAVAIAALVEGDDETARTAASAMRAGSPAFVRAADAVEALAAGDAAAYRAAVAAIVADFEARDEHLTGVPIADTALMLERLAATRGLACRPSSPLLPAG